MSHPGAESEDARPAVTFKIAQTHHMSVRLRLGKDAVRKPSVSLLWRNDVSENTDEYE